MQFDQAEPEASGANHPLAERMAVIAGLSHNIVSGCVFGTFGVMLATAPQALGVSLTEAWNALPIVIVSSLVCAVFAGLLVARLSLRRMLSAGALMAIGAFLLLASSRSYPIYMIAYGALLGPAIAINGIVGPATLVSRWFREGRGLVLGLVHMPIVATFLPIVTNWVLVTYGPRLAYLLPATMIAVLLLPLTLLADDRPPSEKAANGAASGRGEGVAPTIGTLLRQPDLWGFSLSAGAVASGAMLLGVALIPLALSLGVAREQAGLLVAIMSVAAIAGAIGFGWIADRLGGARTLALLCFDLALLWLVLIWQPGFTVLVAIVALLGLHAGGLVPSLGRGLADAFGTAGFSRAYGLATALSLPLTALAVIGSSRILASTGTMLPVIPAMVLLFAAAFVIALLTARRSPA